MYASPISASDTPADPINLLWRASRTGGAVEQLRLLADLPQRGDSLQAVTVTAVIRHLRARACLDLGELDMAQAEASEALAAWDHVAAVIAAVDPQMVLRAHAFHARLASRHVEAYRDFARRQLLELAHCARLKSETILAAIAASRGNAHAAAVALDRIATTWWADLPVRQPGLRAVELAAAAHYAATGDTARAQAMRDRAAKISGVMRAYPEDAPDSWPSQPAQEGLLRFAFAAARLPLLIEEYGSHETTREIKGT